MKQGYKKIYKKCGILLFWLIVWTGLALAVNNKILLVSPLETAAGLLSLFGRKLFYVTAGYSMLRIGIGFVSGFTAALLLAVGSFRFPLLAEALAPVMNLIKATPVASFVVLLLIWWGSSRLAVAVCFLVVLPNIYVSTLEGLKNTDRQLLEMAYVFRLPLWNRFFYIYRPALKPFLCSSMEVSLGMCWKSGVAAEVIGTPDYSIGERLYMSKIYLDTAGVFAWTAVIILLSILFEKLMMRFIGYFFDWEPACKRQRIFVEEKEDRRIVLTEIEKRYDGQVILDKVSRIYEQGNVYCLTSPSGSGKTTLLRVLAGLVKPDGGQVTVPAACSMVFQEDRLCGDYSAVRNVELVTGDRRGAEDALGMLLEREALHKPCSRLSGGMKRRVALVRAMEADSAYVLLDEPFTGMDAETRRRAEKYIAEKQGGRVIIMASHVKEGTALSP